MLQSAEDFFTQLEQLQGLTDPHIPKLLTNPFIVYLRLEKTT